MKCDELKPLVFSLKDLAYIDEPAAQKNFENPHEHAVYKATEVDAAIAELKQKLQDQCTSCPVKMQEDDVVAENDGVVRLKERIAELERMDTEHTLQIAKMNGYINHLEEERRWRKFPDEKPTEDIKFLVINEKGFMQCSYYSPTLHEFQIPVTHWMPLPSAPKEEK